MASKPTRISPAHWLAAFLIVGACAIAFLPVLDADFVNWDDDKNFTENEAYRGLSAHHLAWMFTTFHYGGYHPLSWLSVAIDHAIWGMEAKGYHLTNLALHALNALLVFALVLRVLRLTRGAPSTAHVWAAAGATLLFAVHPLRVETVAWITERRALLATLFWILTILLYVGSRDPESSGPRARTLFWLSVCAYLLSLLAKGMALTLPVLLLVVDVYPLRRLPPGESALPLARRLALEKLPFFAVAIGIGILARLAQQEGAAVRSFAEHPLLDRSVQASHALLFYLWKTILPSGLCALHPLEQKLDWTQFVYFGSVVAVVALTVVLWRARRRWPASTSSSSLRCRVSCRVGLSWSQSATRTCRPSRLQLSLRGDFSRCDRPGHGSARPWRRLRPR